MSKFCGNCGAQLPDDAFVCGMCGVSVTSQTTPNQTPNPTYNPAPQAAPVQQASASGKSFMTTVKNKCGEFLAKMKSDRKFMTLVIAIAAGTVTLLTVLIIVLCSLGGYESAISNKIEASRGDYDAYIDSYPEAYWEDHDDDEFYYIYDDLIDELDDYDIDFEVVDEDEIVGAELTYLKSNLRESWGVSKKDITKAYNVEVLMCTEIDEEDHYELESMTVVKIDGDWYVVD